MNRVGRDELESDDVAAVFSCDLLGKSPPSAAVAFIALSTVGGTDTGVGAGSGS